MKKIEIIISHFNLDRVRRALVDSGVQGMTVSEVNGCSADDAPVTLSYRGREYVRAFQPKIEIDVVLADEHAAAAVAAVTTALRGVTRGDGRIFVSPVEEAIRIRTGERGESAVNGPSTLVARRATASSPYPAIVGDRADSAQAR